MVKILAPNGYDAAAKVPQAKIDDENARVFHILADGFSAFGRVWFVGEEFVIQEGSAEWEATEDVNGDSWLDLSATGQRERWGGQRFGQGPWRGEGYDAVEFADDNDDLTEAEREILAKAEAKRLANQAAQIPSEAVSEPTTAPVSGAQPAAVPAQADTAVEAPTPVKRGPGRPRKTDK